VWIAQREGRAKNGVDRTETALVKMLALGRDRAQPFGEAIAALNLVPVSIAYCFDPCDLDKARELHERETTGSYQKRPHEDLASIYKGIVGDKGAVHVAFGEPLAAPLADDDEVAAWLDRQIVGRYRLQPTNLIAWHRLHGDQPRVAAWAGAIDCDWGAMEAALLARIAGESEGVAQIVLAMYAPPVRSLPDLDPDPLDTGAHHPAPEGTQPVAALSEALKAEIEAGYRALLAHRNPQARLGQRQMIGTIAATLGKVEVDGEGERQGDAPICVVEAGTGTGKTLAYLLATLPIARALGKTVVVATGTVSLQSQLVDKDIPELLAATGWHYRFALAKGRGRYLCNIKLEQCLDAAGARDAGMFLFEDEI